MEPTTVGSLWLENDLHENELEFESYMGRSKKNVHVTSDGIHAEIHEIWTCVAPAAPPLFHAAVNRWRPSQKRRAAGHNRQHVISRRLRVLPTCPEWLRLSPGLPSPAEAGLWQLTQGSRYGSHHARSLETSWWIGNKNCQILRRTHSKLCYM